MPTYDYRCKDCGYMFEHFQPMNSEVLSVCPQCKGELRRLIGTGSAPIFKGSGFYQTDYKNNNKSKTPESSKEIKSEKKETKK